MNKLTLVLALVILVSSCTINILANSSSEESADTFIHAASPMNEFQINAKLAPDESIGTSSLIDVIVFCDECAHFCFRRNLKPYSCNNGVCWCSTVHIK